MPPKKKTDNNKVEVEPVDGPAPVVETDDVPDGHVRIVLAQHWTNPDTGKNWLPGTVTVVDEDTARGLEGAGYARRAKSGDPQKLELSYAADAADQVDDVEAPQAAEDTDQK